MALTGCVRVAYEPALPMPERPPIRFFLSPAASGPANVCLTQEDGDKLAKYLDKLNAFEEARERALEEH
jgi:hypothetical protein